MLKNKKINSGQTTVILSILTSIGILIGLIYGIITKNIVTSTVVGMGFGAVAGIIINYFKK